MHITVGADVEGFVHNGHDIISAIGLIGGSKDKPFLVDKGNLQEDNVLAEFAIDPANSEDEFVSNILTVKSQLVGKLVQDKLSYVIKSSHRMDPSQVRHPNARHFGCDPDFNAWSGFPNMPPDPAVVGLLRTAGGHIHLGYDNAEHFGLAINIIKWMDLFLGIPSVVMDEDKDRRKVYGKPGAFRKKPYGLEYRVLSNFWIADENKMRWAYRQAIEACKKGHEEDAEQLDAKLITTTINSGDVVVAKELIAKYNLTMPEAA